MQRRLKKNHSQFKGERLVMDAAMHVYEVRPRPDKRGFDLISEALPFGRLWYLDANAAVGYAKFSVGRTRQKFRPETATEWQPASFHEDMIRT